MGEAWSLPITNKPWFWLPVVTEWLKTKTGYMAGEIRKIKVHIKAMPSLATLDTEEFLLMRALLEWKAEKGDINGEDHEDIC